ncbi:PTS sugar transporter subunit IIA [Liquorilactobacillus mali]|uniref:PTS system sugar-specific transporter subunit EIIA n=1 Tax=Liquorilactobacillus mali KCTC 3596 = DSM 20444 TaxID=1046596 RepID=J0KZ34_9LACO|nr:PTS glucose transporter subunit IIA [Liquorilactobacillus mali]EJE99705.1 PTS system sugar-specific transporter subunit EIIA [Liquorilactobacillus mali KCTC 3596 = DSM 20444]KRN08979.1 PTS system sugar-specific transporter subunit EIIA [Liquorilactobacillus mali KCTC 3596 = DSM 20444]MDC7953478.1 PTS glucose transporter subunit IIA [Liquorilactobacillus mali]QFQ73875.1 PTS glucose transporter subunit IIA [Liquorilactobacillus mali]
MFNFLKKSVVQADNHLYAPITGQVRSITESSDAMFSQKMMGDGFVVFPISEKIVSPVAGKVTMIADTKHAIGLKMANNVEVLIHLGIDTVNMQGKPFNLVVKVGDVLNPGDKIGYMDLKEIAEVGLASDVMVALTNSDDKISRLQLTAEDFNAGDRVGEMFL